MCEELGIGFVPWSPLGQGFLTGKVDPTQHFDQKDIRSIFPRFTEEARKANQPIVDLVRGIAAGKASTPAQIALAWLLAQKSWIVPIPGTRRLERLEENLGALDVQFTADELRDIDRATSTITFEGARGSGTEQYL